MKSVETPQSRCRLALLCTDITPPVGIYNRMWGAALVDRATAVHRPLSAAVLWLQPLHAGAEVAQVVVAVDHCIFDGAEMSRLREAVARAVSLDPGQVQLCLSHTHGFGFWSRTRADLPGGDLIGPYLDQMAERCATLAAAAAEQARPATIVYGTGRCALAAQRDYWDDDRQAYVCGYNPLGPADDTVLVARMIDERGELLGILVNYACHPTTLAWQNSAISPDFVGAMRETVERQTQVPCLFLQGALGDLGPREGFVGDWEVADRNGRQLGFAALAALESLPAPGTQFVYSGPVISGTPIGTWSHQPVEPEALDQQERWQSRRFVVPLAYRADLPDLEQTKEQLAARQAEEREAAASGNLDRIGDARAHAERLSRQLARLTSLPTGDAFPYSVAILQIGGALWVFVPGEPYQVFQTVLRERFPNTAIIVVTLSNNGLPTYLPTAQTYGRGIYQEVIALVRAGSLELLIDAVADEVRQMLRTPREQ